MGREALKQAMDDNIAGESAKVAYYFFLSFFPLILSLLAFAGIVGGEQLFEAVMAEVREGAPGETEEILEILLADVAQSRPGLLSIGLLLTLWAASNIFAALTDGLNRMYNVKEDRRWWRKRLLAMVALLVGYAVLLPAAAAILAGPEILPLIGAPPFWSVIRWPLAFVLLVGVLWFLYYLLPNRDQKGRTREVLVGALVGTSLWLLATFLFRLYVSDYGRYGEMYGILGGIIVLLLWLYMTALAILFGGEVAAVLEQRAHGKAEAGESLPA